MAQSLAQLQELYDREISGALSNTDPNINPDLGFATANTNQQFYRSADSFIAELLMWRSTGNLIHFTRMKSWIDQMISDATTVVSGGSNYLGWPSTSQCPQPGDDIEDFSATDLDRCDYGTPLWEFFIGRYVMEFLKDIYHSPTFKTTYVDATFPGWFNATVTWWETNVFTKWYNNDVQNGGAIGDNVYRNRTHIATEAAQMALCIWEINGNTLAKEVWDNIMHVGMPAFSNYNGLSMRGQLTLDSANDLYEWSSIWGNTSNNNPQDLNHWGHMVSAIVTGYELGQEWTEIDLIRFANTTNRTVDNFNTYRFYRNINLTGGIGTNGALSTALLFRITQWNETMHDNFADNADANDSNRAPFAGFLYYNEYMLQNPRPIYPEHWVPVDGAFLGSSTPPINPGTPDNQTLIRILKDIY